MLLTYLAYLGFNHLDMPRTPYPASEENTLNNSPFKIFRDIKLKSGAIYVYRRQLRMFFSNQRT